MNKFTDIQKQFIKDNVVGKSSLDLTNLFNKQFNTNITYKQIQYYKKSHKLKSGINTMFKVGQKATNYKPVGSEFICKKDGYTYIKVDDPNTWIHKQIYIYEQAHGKIPKGYSVIFADKNKQNFDLNNLILVKNKDKLVAKNKHLIFEDKELTKSGLLIAQLINKTKEKKKGK